jgi:hypothetical protein
VRERERERERRTTTGMHTTRRGSTVSRSWPKVLSGALQVVVGRQHGQAAAVQLEVEVEVVVAAGVGAAADARGYLYIS